MSSVDSGNAYISVVFRYTASLQVITLVIPIYKNFIQHPLLTFSDYFDHEYFFEQPSFAVQVEYDIRNDILLICIKSSIPHFFSYKRYRNYNYKLCAIFELFYLQFPLRIGIFELSSHILTKTYFVQKLGRTTKITRMYFKIRIN